MSASIVGVCFNGALAAWMPGLSRNQPTRLGRAFGMLSNHDRAMPLLESNREVDCSTDVNNG
jgi:hypothetical protein